MKTLLPFKLILISLVFSLPTVHADEIDDLLEKARATGGKYERIRTIINEEPDQNVRLAAFDLMVNHEDRNMKAIAIDAGLASTDRILQAAAFKAAVFDLESIHLVIREGDNGKNEKPTNATQFIASFGKSYVISIGNKDLDNGTFSGGYQSGEVFGTKINFTDRYWKVKAAFALKDDNAIEGVFEISGYKFLASGYIR